MLPFGKYRGQALKQVPATYLQYLCCMENVRRDGKVVTPELYENHGDELLPVPRSQRYVLSKQTSSMLNARRSQKARGFALSVSARSFPSVLRALTVHGIMIGSPCVTTNVVGRVSRKQSPNLPSDYAALPSPRFSS